MKNLPTIIFWAVIIYSVISSFLKQKKQAQNKPADDTNPVETKRITYKIPQALDIFLNPENFSAPLEEIAPAPKVMQARLRPGEEAEVKATVAAPPPKEEPLSRAYEIQPELVARKELLSTIKSSLLNKPDLQRAFLMSEILQKPKALRHRVHG
jgi:hypothetical protein